jgi:GABA permease
MMGAEVVTIAAAESPEPARAVARMTSTIITRILIFYVGSIFVIVSTVPWTHVVSGQSPFTLALDGIRFPYASEFMAAVILTAVLSCLNSSFYVASRVLFVLGSHGDAPRWLVRTNRRHVPARAVLLASAVDLSWIAPSSRRARLHFVNASGAIIAVIYLAIAVAQVRSRRTRGTCRRISAYAADGCFRAQLSIDRRHAVGADRDGADASRAGVPTSTISIAVTARLRGLHGG